MRLLPLDDPACLQLAAGWLADPQNARWLQFGDGSGPVAAATLKIMAQRPTSWVRAFTGDDDTTAVGVVGLGDISLVHRTAVSWVVLGDKRLAGRHFAGRAMSAALDAGFGDLALASISTWVVDTNVPSRRMTERIGFRLIGRQRQCHVIDGHLHDRLLYDVLADDTR